MEAALAVLTPLDCEPAKASLPDESTEKMEMSGEPLKLVTYTNFPDGSMAMLEGLEPAAIVPPEICDNAPVVNIPYEKTLLLV